MRPDLLHAHALAAQPHGAAKVFSHALEGIDAAAPSLLTTASVYDLANMRSRRVFTQDAAAYPTGNFKRLDRNLYYERVIEGRQPFTSTTIEEIATVFFDWEKIRALGFESNMNLPAIADGQVIGTVNLLNRAGHFTPERVAAAMEWQPVVTLAFLLLHQRGAETATLHPADAQPQIAEGREG
ncbi:hypothetical protein [Pseudogemmobacter sonorensis]|uniref:hypothetical protein n=1 Tax=Pseudogemmobacter sonorensis TaxID=2989681 RepID=UPI00367F981D